MNDERFADYLDRLVAGKATDGADALAAFAHDIQTHQGAARLDPDRRAEIRRSLMQHATTLSATKPTTGGAGPLSQPALIDPATYNPWILRRSTREPIPAGWRGHVVKAQTAIAIGTMFALLIVGFAWYSNRTGVDGPDPSATRYAAAPTEIAQLPEGSPVAVQGSGWTAPIDPQECISRTGSGTGTPATLPERDYGPFTTPSVRDAADAAMTLRRFEACRLANETVDEYANDRFTGEMTYATGAEEVSAAYEDLDASEFVIFIDGPEVTPSSTMRISETPGVYQPKHAIQLADGRIAIPSTLIVEQGMLPDERPMHAGTVVILAGAEGERMVDEMLPFCVGECESFWQMLQSADGRPATPDATPPAQTGVSTPLHDLLAVLPAHLALAEGGALPGWTYAEIDQRFEDLGLTDEQLAEDPLLPLATNAYAPMAHTTPLFDHAADEEFVDAIGFNPLVVDQVLVTGRAPDVLTLLRGDWDEDALIAAWEAAGYTEIMTESGITIWSLDPVGWVDPQHPIQRRMFQQLNNVAILDGGILAFAGTSHTIDLVLQAQSGEMESALDDPMLRTLFESVPEEAVSIIGFTQPGSVLYDLGAIATNPNIRPSDRERIEEPLKESREAVGPMPEYRGAIFSFVGGETIIQLRALSEEDSGQILQVFEWRWQHFISPQYQQTFDSIMPLVEATSDGTTVTLRFDTGTTPGIWLQVLEGDGLKAFAVDAGLPVGTPEVAPATPMAISSEDAAWWTWPSGEECGPEEYPGDSINAADYPEREYLPLGTPEQEDAEAASRVARTTTACNVHYGTVPFSTSRYQAENFEVREADVLKDARHLAGQVEHGRAISDAYPISDPREFGRLTQEEPVPGTPLSLEHGLGSLTTNPYEPFTAVFIPSQAVQLADGRIAIPESLLAQAGDEDLAYRGSPDTWVRHYSTIVVLSDASGEWLVDEVLPFCIGADCDQFWDQYAETVDRMYALATPEASPMVTQEDERTAEGGGGLRRQPPSPQEEPSS